MIARIVLWASATWTAYVYVGYVDLDPVRTVTTVDLSALSFNTGFVHAATADVVVTATYVNAVIGQIVTDPNVAGTLQSMVSSIGSAPTANAKAGKVQAFNNHVAAQTGKKLSSAQADQLTQLVSKL